MTSLLSPYAFGNAAKRGFAFSGALVHKGSSDQTISTGRTVLNWSTEDYDDGSWHDTVSNTHLMSVPSSINLVRIVGAVNALGSNPLCYHEKNGNSVSMFGRGVQDVPVTGGSNTYVNLATAPLVVVGGTDNFQMAIQKETPGTFTPGTSDFTWLHAEAVNPALDRCLMRLVSSQSIPANTSTKNIWDTEVYKTNPGMRDGFNPTRIYAIRDGYWRAGANITSGDGVAGELANWLTVNNAEVSGIPAINTDTSGTDSNNLVSAPIFMQAGDYVECWTYSLNATHVLGGDSNACFWLEEVQPDHEIALARQFNSKSLSAGATDHPIFQEVYDTAGIYDPTTGLFTVPAGCNHARPSFSFQGDFATGEIVGWAEKNSATFRGCPGQSCNTSGNDSLCAFGAWVACSPGDQFRLSIFSNQARTVPANPRNWMALECRP